MTQEEIVIIKIAEKQGLCFWYNGWEIGIPYIAVPRVLTHCKIEKRQEGPPDSERSINVDISRLIYELVMRKRNMTRKLAQ